MRLIKKDKGKFGADWLNANLNMDGLGSQNERIQKEINQYITLKLVGRSTFIYVNGKRFIQCIRLILNIPKEDVPIYDEIDSIDEAANLYSKHVFQNRIVRGPMARPDRNQVHDITSEEEFWGHCSNIQAWVEHDYDTRILMSNIAFPLLRELSKAGDPKASKVFKEEIALRLESGYPSVVEYLINQGYLRYFTPDEFKSILETSQLIKGLSSNPKMLSRFLIAASNRFPTIFEDILLEVLKLPEGIKIILLSLRAPISPRAQLLRASIRPNPRYLFILKNSLENIFNEVDEEIGEDIIDCIQAIDQILGEQGRKLTLTTDEHTFKKALDLIFNDEVVENFDDLGHIDEIIKVLDGLRRKCPYCGKEIPVGHDICIWCGHHKDDNEGGFFPHPYIFKPPGGGGGSTKGTIAVLAKVRT